MKIAFLALCLLLSVGSQAQTVIETPTQTQPTAFAIVIDNATYRATRNAVMQSMSSSSAFSGFSLRRYSFSIFKTFLSKFF